MENQKLRIYWRKLDENGNEIERGADNREYYYMGHAQNRAWKLFGWGSKQFQWRVCNRDPWAKYTLEVTCRVCGQVFIAEDSPYHPGFPMDADSVHLYVKSDSMQSLIDTMRPEYNGYCCPDCAMKIHKFITGLRKG